MKGRASFGAPALGISYEETLMGAFYSPSEPHRQRPIVLRLTARAPSLAELVRSRTVGVDGHLLASGLAKVDSPEQAAVLIMTGIELFQLTMIPAHLLKSGYSIIRIAARLMGTEFSFLDLAAYAAGIACISTIAAEREDPQC